MNRIVILNGDIASGQKIPHDRFGHSFLSVVFLLSGVYFLQGVLHSSSLPDYIEDKKSGGQQTDCLKNTSLCNVSTNIIGREARLRQMLKTVIKSHLIGTL
jgi:hypothetical protein